MNPAIQFLQKIMPISPGLTNYLLEIIKTKEVAKKTVILKPGQISDRVFFIEKGICRGYYKKDDKEICTWFMKEGEVIISVYSFYNQKPSYEYIETLEDCTLHYITYEKLQHLYYNFTEMNFIGRLLTERYYLMSEERLFAIRKQSAIERYKILQTTNPELLRRIASKHIASYLGVNEETLSRLKKKL